MHSAEFAAPHSLCLDYFTVASVGSIATIATTLGHHRHYYSIWLTFVFYLL